MATLYETHCALLDRAVQTAAARTYWSPYPEVPSGKLSTDIGIQVFNVGTAYALARAVYHGEPLISRLVTVTWPPITSVSSLTSASPIPAP